MPEGRPEIFFGAASAIQYAFFTPTDTSFMPVLRAGLYIALYGGSESCDGKRRSIMNAEKSLGESGPDGWRQYAALLLLVVLGGLPLALGLIFRLP
jgi:hypothetical protein